MCHTDGEFLPTKTRPLLDLVSEQLLDLPSENLNILVDDRSLEKAKSILKARCSREPLVSIALCRSDLLPAGKKIEGRCDDVHVDLSTTIIARDYLRGVSCKLLIKEKSY